MLLARVQEHSRIKEPLCQRKLLFLGSLCALWKVR